MEKILADAPVARYGSPHPSVVHTMNSPVTNSGALRAGDLVKPRILRLDARSPRWLRKGVGRGFNVFAGCDGRLDASCEAVDELGELGDCFECPGLAPAGDIGDRLAGGVQSDGAERYHGRRVNDHLGARSAIFGIPDTEPVSRLVNEDPQLRVSGLACVDDDPSRLLLAPPAGGAVIDSNETVNPSDSAKARIGPERSNTATPLNSTRVSSSAHLPPCRAS
jgi:hypothetical protein